MRTTAYLFTVCIVSLLGCSSSSTPPPASSTTELTTIAEVCSPTLGPIPADAGAGDTCTAGATCQVTNGTYACAAASTGGGW
jgi:hypothetical protein